MHILIDTLLTTYTATSSCVPSNKTFLWLHGRQQQGSTFQTIIKELPEYNHITVDLPGFGLTPLPQTSRGVPEYALFIRHFIKKLSLDENHMTILGHSFGGRIAIELTAKKLIKPQCLVLIGSAGIQTNNPPKYHEAIQLIKKICHMLHLTSSYETIAKRFRSRDYNCSGALQEIFLNTVTYDQTNLLASITQPTLLIRGADDTETPLEQAYIMHEKIPYNELFTFPGSHFVYQEQTNQVAHAIHHFLQKHA